MLTTGLPVIHQLFEALVTGVAGVFVLMSILALVLGFTFGLREYFEED